MDIAYYTSSSREWTPRKTQKSSITFIPASEQALLFEWLLKISPKGCQALRLLVFRRGERETRETGDEEQGSMGMRKT